MSKLCQNVGFSLRMLGKNPGFFSAVYGALRAPLPMPHPEQLVMVWSDYKGRNVVSPGDLNFSF